MRQRQVFPSSEIPHLWYHSTQATARNANGSLYFSGDTIYSYGSHFPIAKHVSSKPNMHGERAVLFTTKTYSVTTSGHCSQVRSAIPRDTIVFNVPSLQFGFSKAEDKAQHAQNLSDYITRINEAISKSARARSSWMRESQHNAATSTADELRKYCEFFGLKTPKFADVPTLDSDEMERIRQIEAKQAAKKAEQTRREREEQTKREAEKAERWRNGENVGYFYGRPVMLRLRNSQTTMDSEQSGSNADVVETSLGAQVPVSHALRGLRFVRAVVAKGEAYQRNGHTLHLGHYAIDRIETDGTLHAGCHVITLAEIERIAPVLESLNVQEVQS
jgi:hypothetical protein